MDGELNAITNLIAKLILKRRITPYEQQQPINEKLTKLYNIKRLMLANKK